MLLLLLLLLTLLSYYRCRGYARVSAVFLGLPGA